MLGVSKESLTCYHGLDHPAIDWKRASLEADGRCWLGNDRICLACKCDVPDNVIIVIWLTTSGILHHGRNVTTPLSDSFQLQGKHEAGYSQRHVLYRVLCGLHCLASAVDRATTLLQRSCNCYRNVVSTIRHSYCVPLCLHARQRCSRSGCEPSRSRRRVECQPDGGGSSRQKWNSRERFDG